MTDLLAELAQREAELQGLPMATSDSVVDEAEFYDLPTPDPPDVDADADIPATLPKIEENQAVSASPPAGPYDFSTPEGEAASIVSLNKRIAGLTFADAEPFIRQWESAQRASIWLNTAGSGGVRPPERNGFRGPLKYREIGVA